MRLEVLSPRVGAMAGCERAREAVERSVGLWLLRPARQRAESARTP